MREMKYVIVDNLNTILFDPGIHHVCVFDRDRVTSAGFCRLFTEEGKKEVQVSCYGESKSLKLKSNPDKDAALIGMTLNDPFGV